MIDGSRRLARFGVRPENRLLALAARLRTACHQTLKAALFRIQELRVTSPIPRDTIPSRPKRLAAASSSMADGLESLDPSLWSDLPEELVVTVLALLPLRTLTTLRLVCKKWSSLWYCPVFLQLRSSSAPQEKYWLWLKHSPPQALCYNPVLNKLHTRMFKYFPCVKRYDVLASARGLLLCVFRRYNNSELDNEHAVNNSFQSRYMFVCNPLRTKCSRLLPERLATWTPCLIGMIGGEANKYKVILASFTHCTHGTEVYDSCSRSWKLIPNGRKSIPLPPVQNPSIISRKGCLLYIGSWSRSGVYSGSTQNVCVYNAKTELWSSFELPKPANSLRNLQLEDCRGRLFLVGHKTSVEESRGFSCFADVFVWERMGEDLITGMWEERWSPPAESSLHFPVLPSKDFLVTTARPEDLICYTRYSRTQLRGCLTNESYFGHFTIYNSTLNRWWSMDKQICEHDQVEYRSILVDLPYCPRCNKLDCGVDLLFEPRIDSLP